MFTSPSCLAIAFYFAGKENKKLARQKFRLLADHLSITPIDAATVKKAINNPAVHDFEDRLEYFAALESKCAYIITEDIDDFYFSSVEILTCVALLRNILPL